MTEYMTISAAIVAAMTCLVAIFLTIFTQKRLTDRSEAIYNEVRRRAELSDMREYYESQISKLSDQLTATEFRWKDVNHLILDAQEHQNKDATDAVDPDRFLSGFGIDQRRIKIDRKLIFYLTPFSKDQEREFSSLKRICDTGGLLLRRGDEERIESNILGHIVRNISEARFVVANINGRNPNVLYELGIAQALGKTTFIISKTLEELPFDIQANRVITYSTYKELEEKLAREVVRASLA